MPNSSADRNAVEVLAEEFLDRYREGDRPPVSEYTDRLGARAWSSFNWGPAGDYFKAHMTISEYPHDATLEAAGFRLDGPELLSVCATGAMRGTPAPFSGPAPR